MQTDYETLSLERVDEHVLLIYMDRPEVLNAMNTQMGLEWKALFEGFYVDTQDVRCIVVTGRGERAFCAGG
ncbi:MAG: enoyl-CoA hydratase/isomerase family protein, partial [Gammaproteobacteria bacterium]|nr:enoyl-CoA hydratase/isomerase family protein [Gammaproteobacteria bacterium]